MLALLGLGSEGIVDVDTFTTSAHTFGARLFEVAFDFTLCAGLTGGPSRAASITKQKVQRSEQYVGKQAFANVRVATRALMSGEQIAASELCFA